MDVESECGSVVCSKSDLWRNVPSVLRSIGTWCTARLAAQGTRWLSRLDSLSTRSSRARYAACCSVLGSTLLLASLSGDCVWLSVTSWSCWGIRLAMRCRWFAFHMTFMGLSLCPSSLVVAVKSRSCLLSSGCQTSLPAPPHPCPSRGSSKPAQDPPQVSIHVPIATNVGDACAHLDGQRRQRPDHEEERQERHAQLLAVR